MKNIVIFDKVNHNKITSMKTKLFLLLTFISCSSMFAQSFEKLLYSKKDKPTVLINENIIANWELINTQPNITIKEMQVMKSAQKGIDQYAKTYPNLSEYGLILCKADLGNIETKTQNDIRIFLGADPQTKIYVDGFLLMNDHYLIATKSIKEIEFISPNEQDFNSEKIINIWTLTKDTRLGSLHFLRTEKSKDN
ncbi:carbon monoxide dehydrogenase beta subunit family protein [Chryseobacterium gotjawalense]|uniref:Carbon monoxide dehydrogenase beta subunit family protein n=1 Tax=Chryseobacterium gotjawalense TaxID=3042315 RepID=A0ABY8RCI6_9FLAO|nr:carbon monoxide dehydrogenase beta subunit family protein [Chryseobacterium sp. wdc7]WHF51571.1 carbon monoxide dehydrogenase beta subunit family protein [Chryseobacterium sp. wdc7]